jgi:hypothetical protein
MLGWIIQITFISIIIIFLIHNTITYLKTTLTVPKVKDLVNSQKYENIYKILETDDSENDSGYNINELLPRLQTNDNTSKTNDMSTNIMKNELKNFFKKQLKDETTLGNNF